VSAGAQVAVLAPGRSARAPAAGTARRRRALTLAAFAALGVYGILRWATMLRSPPIFRLLCLVALAVLIAALGEVAREGRRPLQIAAIAAIYVGCLAVLPIAGFPLQWAVHFKVARTLDAVSVGITQLPRVIVPYGFSHQWTRAVIVLGAGLLLLTGGLVLAAIRRGSGELRLACAALPLVVLTIVPSSLAAPRYVYLHGAVLFVLLATFVFSERVAAGREPLAAGAVLLAAVGGMLVAPALDRHSAWIDVNSLAGSTGPGRPGESFNWSQRYGPLNWPHNGTIVLEVRAAEPSNWKAEDLDLFDGHGWVQAAVGSGAESAQSTIAPPNLNRWLQTLTVSFRQMHSSEVIAAGYSFEPLVSAQPTPVENLTAGEVPGTWATTTPLLPGDTYEVRAYTPAPSAAELRRAGVNYPLPALAPDLQMIVPLTGSESSGMLAHRSGEALVFAPYGSRMRIQSRAGVTAAQAAALLAQSPYGPVYALAQRLRRGSHTPYAFVEAVQRYLSRGFVYNLNPVASRYPIASFLLTTRLGYCQQFAGAMALLLRMGGVPARVAVGFTTGLRVPHTDQYIVSDRDAHAWVEAWFPGIGWVQFDPTPPGPSLDRLPAAAGQPGAAKSARRDSNAARLLRSRAAGGAATAGRRRRGNGTDVTTALSVLAALLLGGTIWGVWALGRRPAARLGADALVAELERAFELCRGELPRCVTLDELERHVRPDAGAAAYVRAIRLSRFAAHAPPISLAQRGSGRGARCGR
jgi:transglutaminase-like putative cysteine protease